MKVSSPRIMVKVEWRNHEAIGKLGLMSVGYGMHQAWIYSTMFDDGSVFGISPVGFGFFNEGMSLAYITSIIVYSLLLLVCASIAQKAADFMWRTSTLVGCALMTCVGTLFLIPPEVGVASVWIQVASGLLTGVGSTMLLLAWGVAFSNREGTTIAINGALAIMVGFAVYSYVIHQLPYPAGAIISALIPLLEAGMLYQLKSTRQQDGPNGVLNSVLPINVSGFVVRFGLPVLLLGFALGIMRQSSVATVLTGATSSDLSFMFVTAFFATLLLLTVFLAFGDNAPLHSVFRPLIPFIAITALFIPLASQADSVWATGILLMGYMTFEATMWIFFGQLSERFRLPAVFVYGLGRGLLGLGALAGSLLPILSSRLVAESSFGPGIVILLLVVMMMFAFSLLPDEKEIRRLVRMNPKMRAEVESAQREIESDFAAGSQPAMTAAQQDAAHGIDGADADEAFPMPVSGPDEAKQPAEQAKPSDSSRPAADEVAPTADPLPVIASSPVSTHASRPATPSAARLAMEQPRSAQAQAEGEQEAKRGRFKLKCEAVADTFMLSRRETEVLFYLARGYKSTYIQEKLYISEGTAKTHIRHIYRKVDVHNQSDLMKLVNSVEL